MERPKGSEYYEGLREGVRRWAWWKNGVQYVGSTGTTLSEALRQVNEEEMKLLLEKRAP